MCLSQQYFLAVVLTTTFFKAAVLGGRVVQIWRMLFSGRRKCLCSASSGSYKFHQRYTTSRCVGVVALQSIRSSVHGLDCIFDHTRDIAGGRMGTVGHFELIHLPLFGILLPDIDTLVIDTEAKLQELYVREWLGDHCCVICAMLCVLSAGAVVPVISTPHSCSLAHSAVAQACK